jgi:hypothetical protein
MVAKQADVADAVRALKLRPAAEWDSPQPVFSQRRNRDGTSYFYLWNASPKALSFTGSFAAAGLPRRLDLWTGEQTPVVGTRAGSRVTVPIELAPRETMVLAFSKPAGAVTAERLRPTGEKPLAVSGWQLAVESWGPEGRAPLPAFALGDLKDWRDIAQLRGISGIGTYTATVQVPESWVASGRGARLELGSVEHATVQAYVNGKLASSDVNGYGRPDVSDLLKPGDNEIKVVLATTLLNRARATPTFVASRPISAVELRTDLPTGLLGPVQLLPVTREQITTTLQGERCARSRRVRLTMRVPRGFKPARSRVRIHGRTRKLRVHRSGRRLRASVVIRRGALVRVRWTVRGTNGRVLRVTRSVRRCARQSH